MTADGWLTAEGYDLGLVGTTIVARNAKGRQLKSVPAKARKTDAWQQLDDLRVWLESHDREAGDEVERWLLGSVPVPVALIAAVWPDEFWRSWLTDLVIMDATDPEIVGLLREATGGDTPELAVVDLDGESVRMSPTEILIPHPVLLADLDDLREFSAELGVRQRLDQLYRPVFPRDAAADSTATHLSTWSGADYATLREAHQRVTQGGFVPKGPDAITRVVEDGRSYEIRINLADSTDPFRECSTSGLQWRVDDVAVALNTVGPVAWSEGVRMAQWLWAGRRVEEGEA